MVCAKQKYYKTMESVKMKPLDKLKLDFRKPEINKL
jgi:hypothetical protein